ncbi:hypothetical protein F7018_16060 [Tenacibaculum aiptasiae]|uniref:Uncharacterized protein n=1 Tax=Tenacibaculum aiptasiae TaxID=426481 RepID=A0A7J5A987_9FLAO|nr:hypothetical protein [Tenacibaculum aiptasiae]KAB1153998.1 hypothetical protein F7018_16060 [Tenacibaculum aiptasiae]
MKNIFKTLTLIALLIGGIACKSNKYSFVSEYPVKQLPLIDSTNFDNHVEGKLLNKEEQKLLKLPSIFEDQLDNEKAKIGISYLPKISDNFQSVVFYFYPNNNEVISMLVNYDKDFTIINSQVLAYDEITDGILKTTSKIDKNRIVLTEYVSENPSTLYFKISDKGDITRE